MQILPNTKKILVLGYILFSFFLQNLAWGQETSEFDSAISLFKEKKYSESGQKLEQLLQTNPDNRNLIYNRGVVAFYEGRLGLALACFRKNIQSNPFSFIERDFETKIQPMLQKGQLGFPNPLDEFPFYYLTIDVLLFLSLIAFTFFCWLWISHLAERRQTSEEIELATPWKALLVSLLTFFLLGLSYYKYETTKTKLVTVIKDNLALKTQVDESSPTISELPEGLQVELLQTHEDWVQISHPNYSVGWVKKTEVL